jgi:hypothetical protein
VKIILFACAMKIKIYVTNIVFVSAITKERVVIVGVSVILNFVPVKL